jgi:hypothetical protein
MTREDCPGCNSEPGNWICLFHGMQRKPRRSNPPVNIQIPSYDDVRKFVDEALRGWENQIGGKK